ncbi:MAG: YncE family protein, partial [Candidatus Hydrogenedentales bacterium]
MNTSCPRFLCVTFALLIAVSAGLAEEVVMRSPSGERYVEMDVAGTTILPNGRFITPSGPMIRVQPHPYGLTMSPDGRWVIAACSQGPQLSILDVSDPAAPKVAMIPEEGADSKGVLDATFMGLAVDPEKNLVYVAGGGDWSVVAFDLSSRARLFRIDCAHTEGEETFQYGYLGDLRLSPDRTRIYAVDQSNFRLLIIDVAGQKVLRSIPVGRYPFGVTLSPDGKRAYVANVGMFEYAYLRDKAGRQAAVHFPPYGVPSKEAEEGYEREDLIVPGLGDPNDIRGMSVWTVDISNAGKEKVVGKTKTGHLVGEQLEDFPAVGGSSPNSLAATESHVYVSNGSNDSITVIKARSGKREKDIDLVLAPAAKKLRGMIPFGVALSPDKQRLYVCEAGINA